jgi:hypothetical protein
MPLAVKDYKRGRGRGKGKVKREEGNQYLLDAEEKGRDLRDPERKAVGRARRDQSGETGELIGLIACWSGWYGRYLKTRSLQREAALVLRTSPFI